MDEQCAKGLRDLFHYFGAPNRFQKKVLEGLSVDCLRFVFRSFGGGPGGFPKGPDVPWSVRLPSMSVSYSGEIVDKAKWLTFAQQVSVDLFPPVNFVTHG